ncbi:MAG: SpaA isopeptide-forming pilin-related protein [Hominenteromicrobium sp.]|uniref:SpaA isopeptide-forming pilin-related protein n=1 Tax=Hominenteromicrobium sp. TaxID=3073581 RepID=UPI00399FC8B6
MKKAKRLLAGALAALILAMSLPLSALADEANVPAESPSFEVSFDVDTGQEEISEDLPADIEATPEPTPESTTEPTPTPESTVTPAPTAEPTAVPTATPGVTATPTAVSTSTPEPSAVPSASPVVTPTPTPSPQPVTNPIKLEHEVLTDYETGGLYLFPVPDGDEITQEYSEQHKAWDIAAVTGSAVVAAEEGTVTYVQIWDGSYDTTGMMSYGHMIQIEHPDGNTTLYAHLSEINVQQDEKVVRGQRIGRVGSTGNSTGPHLHFEVMSETGKKENPEPVLEYGVSTLLDDYTWSWVNQYLNRPNGTKTISDYGVTRDKVVAELTSHQSDNYYLGTTYVGGDSQSPKGDTSYNGSVGMNCAGFVSYVLCKLGLNAGTSDLNNHTALPASSVQGLMTKAVGGRSADWYSSYKSRNLLAGASNYCFWIANGDLKSYAFQSKSDMLSSGVLEKGDIILMLPTTASASDRDTHIGFFWGNSSSEDNMWHSFGSNNHISTITPKTSPSYYVVIKYAPSEYTLTLNKTSSNPSLTNNNSNYSLSGAVYEVYGNKTTYTTSTVTYYTVNASGGLNLRSSANTSSSVLITMTNGASVRYLSTSGSWYRVEYTHSNGTTYTGYASSTYLTNKTTQTIYTPTVTSNALLGTLTTNSSGSASLVVPAGTVSVKEKTAPKGFSVDNETHTVTMDGNKTLNVSDTPIIYEYNINLTKTSANVSITNGDSGYSLAGAVYKIYNSSGTEVASITTNSSGKGSSNVKLKNGTYTAVESKAPPGYALDTTRHTVRINNADAILNVSDVPLIKTVTLTKTSANTSITAGNSNYSLAGAVYDVYEGNSATGTPVASFTTNSSGVATLSRKLYPNRTYTILERTPPPGYVKDTTPHPFYLTYNAATMDVVDDPTTIRLTVKKKDSETNTSVAQGNASLAGAQYKVTYVNGTKTVENIVTTNSSGSATLRGLPIGVTVTVQEITAPAGYKLDSRVHTYVTTTKTEKIEYDLEPEDFTEDVFKGHIQITKQIEMLGADAQLEQGAEYQVYLKSAGSYANAKDTERDYLVTGADGKSITKDLPYGTYTLHQVKGVPGREFKDMDVDVHENGKTYEVTLTNELKYAPLKIVKTSEDGNVAGFTFKVTRLADGYSKTYTTNAAGEIITDQMPVYVDADATQLYEYKVEEINVPDKYRTPDAQTVTLTYGQTAEVSFYNQIARGSLEILKVDHDGVTPLEGAKFEITDDNGNVIATETSGPDGKIKVESILYGKYHWSEVEAPKGYDLDDTVHDFAIEHDEQVIEITQENTPSVGSITAKKVDADGNAMSGVEFTLEYSTDDGATWAPVEARAEDSKPSIGGCTSAVVDGALETDENGVATFNGLQINNQTVTILYRLTETATKSGNTLLAAPMFIGSLPQVLDDGTEIVDVTVTAVNNQNYTLPSSGGNGMVSVPVGIALALISVSCFAAWLWKKKLF